MLRFLILSGYFELMMYLQVSGKLDQYINVHSKTEKQRKRHTSTIMTMGCQNLINVESLMYCLLCQ